MQTWNELNITLAREVPHKALRALRRIHCNTCACDIDPRIRPCAADSPTVGPARLPHWPSLPPPFSRQLATERPPTRRAAASARATARIRRRPHACTRCDARPLAHQRASACGQRPHAAFCCMARRGAAAAASGGLGAAADAEEEIDLVLTIAPIRCLRARAGKA